MKILVIIADCITTNSSANLCHLAYLNGFIHGKHQVTLISGDSSSYITDQNLTIPDGIETCFVDGASYYEKLAHKRHGVNRHNPMPKTQNTAVQEKKSSKQRIVHIAKETIRNTLYGSHGIYKAFVRKAKNISIKENFDWIVSISPPSASHLLAHKLLSSGRIHGNHWLQIWEDPWYGDVYLSLNQKIYRDEKKLLQYAEKVCYVSPLTLFNQQRLFPESAGKMYWQPLPYYYKRIEKNRRDFDKNSYGYFGDYVPQTRDLKPFYEAARQTGIQVNICGSPNNLFASTESITIYPRLPLDKLKPIEDKTNVLIFLCNRKGGQIPGKIYQYSATYKTILFILDGTDEEKKVLRNYFEKFNRYVFCENSVEDITRAIKDIENGNIGKVKNEPVEALNPKETIRKILAGEMG